MGWPGGGASGVSRAAAPHRWWPGPCRGRAVDVVRTGAPAGQRGYFHEALLYDSDEEFLAVALPFLRDGVAAGEPVVVALGDRSGALVQAALGDTAGVDVAMYGVGAGVGRYTNPVDALGFYR